MKTIKINLYSFNELNEQAKQKALNEHADINVSFDWWSFTFEDAANIGLKITSFDLDRNRHAEGVFNLSASEVAANIIRDHGQECETYKTAVKFLEEHEPVFCEYLDENGPNYESAEYEDKLMEIEGEFIKSLLEDYSIMLQKECEYLQSDEAIIETFEANDYTFEDSGKMRN